MWEMVRGLRESGVTIILTTHYIDMLPPFWQKVTLLNPVVYLISAFRWSFYEVADVSVTLSAGMILLFLLACLVAVRWMFKTGYRLRA
jgi:ABC-2 type transport system permease protein